MPFVNAPTISIWNKTNLGLCDEGQRQLMEMNYLAAESTLAAANTPGISAILTHSRAVHPPAEARRRRNAAAKASFSLDLLAEEIGGII